MRLFVALDFPNFFLIQKKLPSLYAHLRMTRQFHLTLRFLGEMDSPEGIITGLEGVGFEPFSVRTSHIGCFPDTNNPRVIWMGLEDSRELMALKAAVDKSLGFEVDRHFVPHLTMARVSSIKDRKGFMSALGKIMPEETVVPVDRFILYKSTLTQEGPRYEVIREFSASRRQASQMP